MFYSISSLGIIVSYICNKGNIAFIDFYTTFLISLFNFYTVNIFMVYHGMPNILVHIVCW